MNKLMITTLAAVTAVAVNAQEFGGGADAAADPAVASVTAEAEKALPPPTGEGAGVEQVQQVMNEEVAPAQTAKQAINEYLASKDLAGGYDPDRDRIIVQADIEFDVKNPKVSTDFIKLRKAKMDELLLMGKAKIIEGIMSKMSGSRILDVPGNPIAKQLEKKTREMNKALEVARENLAKLDKNLAEKLAQRDGITASELVAVISSWFTSAEKENIAAKMDEQKKADYAEAKSLFEDAEKTYRELGEKAEALKGTIKSKMKTSIDSISEMPIYGCTVLQQAESIRRGGDGQYKYQIAIAYAWSGEMMKAAGEILKGESMTFKPGKKSIRAWLNSKAQKGALSQWIGPRQFIDDKGNMWFIGISAAPVMDDSDDNNSQREIAELEAKAEVMFALYADAFSSKKLERLTQTKVGANGQKQYQTLEDYSKSQGESFKDILISGNMELYSDTVHHVPSGLDVQVVVYGVNSGNVKTLKDIKTRATALGIEVNTAQEKERGYQEQLKSSFEKSKNISAARAEGAGKAKSDLAAEAAKAKARRAARQRNPNAGFHEVQGQQSAPTGTGKLKTGTAIITDDDDE